MEQNKLQTRILSTINPSNAEATYVQSTRTQRLWKPSKPFHISTHWKALTEYSQMSTYLPGFHSFLGFSHHFVLAKLATSSIRVNLRAMRTHWDEDMAVRMWRFLFHCEMIGYLIPNQKRTIMMNWPPQSPILVTFSHTRGQCFPRSRLRYSNCKMRGSGAQAIT